MLDFKICPKCSNNTANENDVCPNCGYHFEKKSQQSDILPQHPDSQKPIVPSENTPSKDATRVWNDLNSLTHWTIIIFILSALLENPAIGIIGALIGYYWLGPWAANFAIEHKRNINWAYFFGFLFAFLGCALYWIYVKVTTDPIDSPYRVYHQDTTAGEWVVLGLSLVFAFYVTFSQPIEGGISNIFNTLLGSFIISLIILYIVYWLITKLFPRSKYWSFVFWIFAIAGIPIILLVVAGFVMGMVGLISSEHQAVDTFQTIQKDSNFRGSTFTNNELHFTLLLPQDWTSFIVDSKSSSTISSDSAMSESVMPKIVYLYTKNYDASQLMVMIMGIDFSKSSMPDTNIQSFNDGFIEGLKQGLEKSQSRNVMIISKGQNYQISGYPSCANEISYTTQSGVPSRLKIFSIKSGSKFYIIYYQATDNLYDKQLRTFEQIVGSFTPTN